MEFTSAKSIDSDAEQVFWDALRAALAGEAGFGWRKFPITSISGSTLEPDVVLLHRQWGLIIIEVKGCWMRNIEEINGHTWYMNDWYEDEIEPLDQARTHMFSILERLKKFRNGLLRDEQGNCRIPNHAFVALPFITEQEWNHRFASHLSAPKREAIFSTQLDPQTLRQRIGDSGRHVSAPLSDEEWSAAVAVLTNSEGLQTKPRRPPKKSTSRASYLRKVEEHMAALDLEQHRFAIQVPPGPQRLRGLAGTGKTVVLAQKAAQMHVSHPDWSIIFSFYTRSLYGQIYDLLTRFVQQFSQGKQAAPNWEKIGIYHGWGANDQDGVYRAVCNIVDAPFRTYTDAYGYFATRSPLTALDKCCQELLEYDIPERFDAIFIDEGQDFGPFYYQLCYRLLRQPKRVIWGYDEVQSLEALAVPTAEALFGKDADGNSLVDLDGTYPGDIDKDQILYRCYRNPRPILLAAHAFGLGLLRKGGAVQFIDTVGGWQDIGYELRGAVDNKLQTGTKVKLHRPPDNSPHHLEKLIGYHGLIQHKLFDKRDDELQWISDDIVRNVQEEELKPDEIVVITLEGRKQYLTTEFNALSEKLSAHGIELFNTGAHPDMFRAPGRVSFATVYRAKGNEASLVYVYGFERVAGDRTLVKNRNTAFTAMTRSKAWLVLTGLGELALESFREIDAILEEIGCVSFVVPDMARIQRNLETYENQRKRERKKKAEKSMRQLIKDLADVPREELSEDDRKLLIKLLLDESEGQES